MNGLPSVLCTDNLQDLLFSAPYDALFKANQATALFAFDDLRIFELTFRTLFRPSEAILEEPPAETGGRTRYTLWHALQPITATSFSP